MEGAKNIYSDSSKYEKVAIMIPYTDGLAILENLEDADGKLTMTISKGVRFQAFRTVYGIKNHESFNIHEISLCLSIHS